MKSSCLWLHATHAEPSPPAGAVGMPLAAVLPLGIIMGALTVTGMGLDASHRVFSGERRKPQTDRWKEAMYERDRMIKSFYS